jgi:HAD superfamily hydrolase (TIGR01509 family)
MGVLVIIFDFDQTLVDTSPVEHLRAQRAWGAVMAQANKLPVYEGITPLIVELASRQVPLAIVTKSPDMVPKHFVRTHKWPIDIVLGYHQIRNRKPHPEGLLMALNRAGVEAQHAVHIGDQAEDTEAARAAGITAIGVHWGLSDCGALEASAPDALFGTVTLLRDYLLQRFA